MQLGDIEIELVQKDIKNVHLSVMPPAGRVRIAAPLHLSEDTIRLYAISKLGWIRTQQRKIRGQARESKRLFLNKETHYFQGRKYLLRIHFNETPSRIILKKKYIDLHVRPGTSQEQCQVIMDAWYRNELKKIVPQIIAYWQPKIGVQVKDWGIKKMRTKWGTCNIEERRLWLNLELAKKPLECLEYIVVHEMIHILERRHNDKFLYYMNKYSPQWKAIKEKLNSLPVGG